MPECILEFDPVSTGTILTPRSPINAVRNPSAILILKQKPTKHERALQLSLQKSHCARIELAGTMPRGERMVWTIESVSLTTGRRETRASIRARFFENDRTRLEAGRAVHVYGVKEGRIRITAACGERADTYEAIVVSQRALPIRVQLLRDETDPSRGSRATAAQAVAHIKIANIYLRQIGIRLIPDEVPDTTDSARACALGKRRLPGFFEVCVAAQHLRDVPNDRAPEVIRHNARPGVVQICYLEAMRSGASGRSINYPGNAYGEAISLTYRPAAGMRARRHTMILTPAKLETNAPDIWGLVVTNVNEGSDPDFTFQKYANTIAHEVGHLLDLAHRDAETDDPKNDGLILPRGRNLMHAASQPPEAEDLDLIQALAARGSEIFEGRRIARGGKR